MLELPSLEFGPPVLVSVERYRLETERAILESKELLDALARATAQAKDFFSFDANRQLVRPRFHRELTQFKDRLGRYTKRLEREFSPLTPADERLDSLRSGLLSLLDCDRKAAHFSVAGYIFGAMNDVSNLRAMSSAARTAFEERGRAGHELYETVRTLRAKYPELMENFGLDNAWVERLPKLRRDHLFKFN
jgi:hypothetical protein